jgi:hypothetical protein
VAHSKRKTTILGALRAFAVATVALLAVNDAWADPVTVGVNQTPVAGRITFGWPSPVPFVARIQNRQLIVQFGRPVEASFAGLPGVLSRYIGAPSLSNGNRTVSFPLQGSFDLNFFAQGNSVIVEVVDTPDSPPRTATPSAAAPATSAPQQLQVQPQNQVQNQVKGQPKAQQAAPAPPPTGAPGERIGVRTGEHEQYGRVVFDWERDVPFRVEQRGNRAVVTFDRPATIALGNVAQGGAKNVAGATTEIVGNSTIVTLNVPSSSKIQSMRSGPKVVIDVYNPTGPNDAAAAPTQPAPPQTAAAAPAPAPVAAAQPAAAAPPPSQPRTPAPQAVAPPAAAPEASAPAASPAPATAAPKAAASAAPPPVGTEASWRVDWTEPVGAAVFRRAGSLWIVFDRSADIDTAAASKALTGIAKTVTQIESPRGTFVRVITTEPDFNPSIRRDGFAWIFDFRRQPLAPLTAIEPKSEQIPGGASQIVIAVAQPGEALPLRDPEVGDNVVIVPIIPLANGVLRPYTLPQFDVLPSAQGIVIHPRIDDLRVRPVQRGVEVSGVSQPLVLSPLTPQAQAGARIGSFRQVSRIFPPDSWRVARRIQSLTEFNKENAAALDKVADAQPGNKMQARLDYAQFLIAGDMGYEAIGVLDTMALLDPAVENRADFRLLRGAANFLMDRNDEAARDFDYPAFNDNDEGEFWRAIGEAITGHEREAAPMLKAKGDVFRAYPRALKMRLGEVIVNAALSIADIQMASSYLEVLAEEKPQGNEIDRLALLEGKVHQLSGNFDQAVAAWEAVEKGSHRPSMAEATVLRANLLLAQKKITPKDAIVELEKLRYAWRGGEFEFNLLKQLGQLYLSIGDYRNGLRTLQEAVTYFRDNPESAKVTDMMVKAFDDLYLKGAADSMGAVRAIALFDEFKELAPSGEAGDEMIRKLADRLAAIDLLDRAALLLEDQVQYRLKGVEKARVGARLATLYLLNHQPLEALAAIEKTRVDGVSDDLLAQRRHLQARALVDQGRVPDAERLLERDESAEADQLRAEIYWGQGNWIEASKSLQKLVARSGAVANKPLNEEQAHLVLNFATAVTLSGNERGAAKLKQDFGAAMNATPFKDAFNLIATPNATGLIDYKSITDRVKTASNFHSFMSVYKQRMKEGKLSTIN